jgi:hypothetical protein
LGISTININCIDKLQHHLACADFYFYIKPKANFIKIEQQFYYALNSKKYSFRSDLFVKLINDDEFLVEIDLCNRRFEDKVKQWEGYYLSGEFKTTFKKYPPIVIVTTNIDKVKSIIDRTKKLELNYIFKDYEEIKNWSVM